MPFTFAHPAAVLPFRRFCPSFFSFPGLVVGSMAPDAGYYVHNWQWAVLGHSFIGSLTFDVPAGLVLLAVFYLSLKPVAAIVPEPHRQTILSWARPARSPSVWQLLVVIYSIVLGAWTHILWDGFTHANGWCVRNLSALTPTVFSIGSYQVTVWQLLQHASTILGFVLLWRAYRSQVVTREAQHFDVHQRRNDRMAAGIVLILPAVFACVLSASIFQSGINMFSLASFSYTVAVRYVDFVLPSFVLAGSGILLYRFLARVRFAKLSFAPPGYSADMTLAAPVSEVISPPSLEDPVVIKPEFPAGTGASVTPPLA